MDSSAAVTEGRPIESADSYDGIYKFIDNQVARQPAMARRLHFTWEEVDKGMLHMLQLRINWWPKRWKTETWSLNSTLQSERLLWKSSTLWKVDRAQYLVREIHTRVSRQNKSLR